MGITMPYMVLGTDAVTNQILAIIGNKGYHDRCFSKWIDVLLNLMGPFLPAFSILENLVLLAFLPGDILA